MCLWTTACIAPDRLRWWIGSEVTAVTANIGHYGARTEGEDFGVAHLEFANGASATMEISLIAAPAMGRCRAEVTGSNGAMEIATWRHLKVASAEDQEWETMTFPRDRSQFVREDGEFVASILEQRAPLVTGEDGKRAVAIVQGIYQAAESGESGVLAASIGQGDALSMTRGQAGSSGPVGRRAVIPAQAGIHLRVGVPETCSRASMRSVGFGYGVTDLTAQTTGQRCDCGHCFASICPTAQVSQRFSRHQVW